MVTTTTCILPVKPLIHAKTRLAKFLSPNQRARLAINMFLDVLETATSSDILDDILVVTSDSRIQRFAEEGGAEIIFEKPPYSLNSAIKRTTDLCLEAGTTQTVVCLSDVPLVREKDFREICRLSDKEKSVAIAPSRDGKGTNILLRRPPNAIETSYGRNSFRRHAARSRIRQLSLSGYYSEYTGLDIDTLEDLKVLLERGENNRTCRFVEKEIQGEIIDSL